MPKRRRASLILTDEERLMIERLCRSKKSERRLAERAQVLRQYASGERVSAIALSTGLTRISANIIPNILQHGTKLIGGSVCFREQPAIADELADAVRFGPDGFELFADFIL